MVFSIISYFTIPKSYFINYIILFYNTPNIPKLYFFPILFKYSFLILFLLFLLFSSFSSLSPSTSSTSLNLYHRSYADLKPSQKKSPSELCQSQIKPKKKKNKQTPFELRRPQTKLKPNSDPNPLATTDPKPKIQNPLISTIQTHRP